MKIRKERSLYSLRGWCELRVRRAIFKVVVEIERAEKKVRRGILKMRVRYLGWRIQRCNNRIKKEGRKRARLIVRLAEITAAELGGREVAEVRKVRHRIRRERWIDRQ